MFCGSGTSISCIIGCVPKGFMEKMGYTTMVFFFCQCNQSSFGTLSESEINAQLNLGAPYTHHFVKLVV